MKKIILLITVNLCFVMNLRAQTECNYSPGSIGAASETICYNGNPALITNSETNNAIALFNELYFGIHNDIIDLPDDVWFTGNYTIESWVKPQNVRKLIFTPGFGNGYEIRMIGNVFESTANSQDFVRFAYGDENTWKPSLTVVGSNGSSSITSSIAIPENQWSHLAVSFNGTTATMYINGQVVATGPMAVPTSIKRFYNRIGNGRSVGQFDEVRIWNVYRTAEEIMATMNVPLLGSETGLKAYYDCNQGTAYVNNASITTLIDKSPNNKNATLSNFYMVEDQSNFVNGSPATINASGGSGTFTYKWQANGVDIANSNSATFDPPLGLTATTTYTRFAEDETCNTFKQSLGSYVVTVRENFLSGEISSIGESICNNGDPTEIGSTTAASGGNGAITYKWQENGADIANSNSDSYDPPAGLTATTTYTRFAKDTGCSTIFSQSSGSYVVTVRENFLSGEISSAGESICNNGDSAVISSTAAASGGDGAFTYKWQANGVDIANSDSDSYDPPTGLTATTTYTRFAKEGTCNTSFLPSSGSYVITVRGSFSTGEISSVGETICNNGDPAEIGSTTAASGGDGAITYKWQANGVDIANSNTASYDPPTGLTATTTYTRFAKEGTCDTSFTPSSGSYMVTVRGNFSSGEISSAGESICNNGDPALIGSTTAASSSEGSITYKWQANGVDIANSDSDSYDPPTGLTATTTYTRFAKDGTCYTSFTPSSGSYMVTVNPNLTSSVNIVADNAVYPNAIAITASAVNGGTSPIYQWYNGTTAVGTNSATYTTTTLTLGQSLAIKVVMTSNATPCLTGSTTTSNIIHIAAPIVPSVRLVSAGIGVASTEMDPSALLEVKSDTKGFLPPRMTATERDAIASPVAGLMLYCSNCGTNGELEVYNGTTWTNLGGSAAAANVGSATATSIVSDPTNFNIKTNTVVAVDQLDITPSADFSLNTGITRNTTATNSITNAAISRYYKFGATTNAFSGILKINYDETELNGLTESNLKILYHNGTIWNSDVNSSNNATNNFVQSSSLSSVALNEVTTGIGEIPTGPISFCAGAKVAAAVGSTSLKFYTGLTGGSPLAGTTALTTKTYYVTETTNSGPSARVPLAVTVNALPATPSALTSLDAKNICKYIDSDTPVLFAATATGASSYIWTTTIANITEEDITNDGAEAYISFKNASTTPGAIGSVKVQIQDANGCISLAKELKLTTKVPTAPTSLTMTSANSTPHFNGIITPAVIDPPTPAVTGLVGLNSLVKITKVGPYMGTGTVFTLTAAEASTAASYAWTLPTGVNQLSGGNSNVITVDFLDAESGIGSLPIVVQSVGGCGNSTNRTLTLARALPTAPTKLVLTDEAITLTSTVTTKVVTKVGPYTAKETPLTLTATPFTTQGGTATSYAWVLPAGVNCTSPHATGETPLTGSTVIASVPTPWTITDYITTTTSTITINLDDVQSGVTALPIQVFAVNGAGNSIARTLALTAAAPATPAIVGSGGNGTATQFGICSTKTYTATSIPGATYTWTVPAGAQIVGATNGYVIEVNYSATSVALNATSTVTCSATNGTGTSGVKSLTVKRVACTGARLAPEAATTEKFSVVAYPNPSSTNFNLNITTSSAKNVEVKVYDMIGKLINKMEVSPSKVAGLQIGDRYPSGVYNVIVSQGTEVKTLRVIKE